MRLSYLLLAGVVTAATGCALFPNLQLPGATQSQQEPPKVEAPKVESPKAESPKVEVVPATTGDAEALVQYTAYMRRLNAADQGREQEAMKQLVAKNKTEINRAELALTYALPGLATRDDARALGLLEPLAKEATSPAVRNFALMLLGFVAENRRVDESLQIVNGKLKDEQKQSAELQQKLEALKSIEKSLSDRDRGKAPPPKK
jgi:hypothetical protein